MSWSWCALSLLVAQTPVLPGHVQLPLNEYNALVDKTRDPRVAPTAAPARHALGAAAVIVAVSDSGPKASATVDVTLSARVFEDGWALVPLLPGGTAVSSATVDGAPIELVVGAEGLGFGVATKGVYQIALHYAVDAQRSERGMALAIPVPKGAAIGLTATLPGSGLDVVVIPAAGTRLEEGGDATTVRAEVPSTSGVLISWRTPNTEKEAMSRAHYRGTLVGDAMAFSVDFDVEVFHDETVRLALFPKSTTLSDVRVDGKSAPILAEEEFATLVRGRGNHKVTAMFEVPVTREEGPPKVHFAIPEVPVSRFDLTLPGKKEVVVEPRANVVVSARGGATVCTAYLAMGSEVTLGWSEAVPEAVKAEVRANADIYHLVHADEGVLYVRAISVFDVTRGATNALEIELPAGAQVNDVRSDAGGVSEWIPAPAQKGRPQRVTVFFDREIKGEFRFDVSYERKLPTGDAAKDARVEVPVMRAVGVNRQRGFIALLAGKDFTLKPVTEERVTRVGENQLPAFVRQAVEMTLAHTFKYVDDEPRLTITPAPPERKEGKFDARVDTLISLGDVTLKGSTSVDISVKSGGVTELRLALPKGVNFLGLTAPSKRSHKVDEGETEQVIEVQFTQEMQGQFRVDVTYERIMAEGEAEVHVPTLSVKGAEVEQGRIAVEALSAVEVRQASAERLSSLDINELPQQLLLKTTNPILLAYKYVQPSYALSLAVTRHQEIDVQAAAIDRAEYRTLFTRDGHAVTTAKLTVRNNREQFLRMQLPEGSEVWSAFVDGKPEKPALAGGAAGEAEAKDVDRTVILIKIINSADGFPVELVYETPVSQIGAFGTIEGTLPHPDMIVTNSHWEVYLPDGVSYGSPSTNMQVIEEGGYVSPEAMRVEATTAAGGEGQQPLHIVVPTSGVRYVFDKLYANRSDEDAGFSLSYASAGGAWVAPLLAALGTALLWFAALVLLRRRREGVIPAAGSAAGGAVLLAVGLYFGATFVTVAVICGLALVALAARALARRFGRPRAAAAEPGATP